METKVHTKLYQQRRRRLKKEFFALYYPDGKIPPPSKKSKQAWREFLIYKSLHRKED